MKRYTPSQLKAEIESANVKLADAGIKVRFVYAPAYEWQGVELRNLPGEKHYCALVERGTSRECSQTMATVLSNMLNRGFKNGN